MDFLKITLVGAGGLLGSIGRYLTAKIVDEKLLGIFPYGTLTVNVIGSLILGLIYGLMLRKVGLTDHWKLFLGTGFCGGFTTFSTFALENVTLLDQKLVGTSLLYIAVSLVLGLVGVVAGIWLSRFF